MTSNQLHGKRFEDWIKSSGKFPGSSDAGRSNTADFDIEARFDRDHGLPTSVKSSKDNTITLSDARRFFAISNDFRMLVGQYKQEPGRKIFDRIHEFIVTTPVLDELRGELSFSSVAEFHDGLGLSNFPVGFHVAARLWAKAQKAELRGVNTRIILNPKIDSDNQRRLQCSIRLSNLVEACERNGVYELHTQSFGLTVLPQVQLSPKRKFKK